MARTHRCWCALALAGVLLAAGCSNTSTQPTDTVRAPEQDFPVTVTNCGVTTTYDRPPTRAVALNQQSIENLLALGVEGSMRGTGFLDDQILPEYQAAYDEVPVLAEDYPSFESLLAVEPDFVYAGSSSAFDEGGRDRQRLADAGIDTYLTIEECTEGPATMSMIDDEIRNLGAIFGVPDRAEQVIHEVHRARADVEATIAGVEPVDVAVYDSGQTTVLTAGGDGIGNEIIRGAGGNNVFADLPKDVGDVSFEQFAQRAPEVIIIYDHGDQSVERKKQFLLSHPMLQDVPAIQQQRFAVVPLSSVVLGVRAPRGMDPLARQLHPDRF